MSRMQVNVKKKFSSRSDRVKSVDLHPQEPWILSSLYNGNVYIYNYQTQSLVKQFEVTELPVRCAKFVARKQWVLCGADDMNLRVYNYNTMETVKKWEAHVDYIRSVSVHPTNPYILSSADDMLIKLWDWERGFQCMQVFEGHTHYVMMTVFNPHDPNTFASASLDKTVKVWGLSSGTPHFTLEGHEKGVNCVEYFRGGDKPYIMTGADDHTVKVWDYQNKTCVSTLEGHTHNISSVKFHPELPIILSGSEDGSVRLWNSNTYRFMKPLTYGWDRVWAIACIKGSNAVGIGYDEGTILCSLGREEPAASMDQNGKIIWAKENEIMLANIRTVMSGKVEDGETLSLAPKPLGHTEVYPQRLQHSSKGRFVVAIGDGEYTIYTGVAWRNKSFGSAVNFGWSNTSNAKGQYAVREANGTVRIFNNFEETQAFKPGYSSDNLFGGSLIGLRAHGFMCFYDWESSRLVRKIEVQPRAIYWSENGQFVAICAEDTYYILEYNKGAVMQTFEEGAPIPDDGIPQAFEVLNEIPEQVTSGTWVGDCFIYTNNQNRLNYAVGTKTETVSHLERNMFILGYLPRFNRIFLMDKSHTVQSFTIHLSIINYQTAVLRGDMETAAAILPKIPESDKTRIAQFLEAQGYLALALETSQDDDHRFDLAVKLKNLQLAYEISNKLKSDNKWKQIADLAMRKPDMALAEECLKKAKDTAGLLLLYTSQSNTAGMAELADLSKEKKKNNVAFVTLLLMGKVDECLDLLMNTDRIPEAVLFARAYVPSRLNDTVSAWRKLLHDGNKEVASRIAVPEECPEAFPLHQESIKAEKVYRYPNGTNYWSMDSDKYLDIQEDLAIDLLKEFLEQGGPHNRQSAPVEPVVQEPVAQTEPLEPLVEPVVQQTTPAPTEVASVEPVTKVEQVEKIDDDVFDEDEDVFDDELEKDLEDFEDLGDEEFDEAELQELEREL